MDAKTVLITFYNCVRADLDITAEAEDTEIEIRNVIAEIRGMTDLTTMLLRGCPLNDLTDIPIAEAVNDERTDDNK